MLIAIYSGNAFVRGLLEHHCAAAGHEVARGTDDTGALVDLPEDAVLCLHLDGPCDGANETFRCIAARGRNRIIVIREGVICETLLEMAHARKVDALLSGVDAVGLMSKALEIGERGYRMLPNGPTAGHDAAADDPGVKGAEYPIERRAGDAGAVPHCAVPADGRDALAGLSPKERIILRELTRGASNKVIAQRLLISDATVKVHMRAIFRKIGVQNRTQAAIWARENLRPLAPPPPTVISTDRAHATGPS